MFEFNKDDQAFIDSLTPDQRAAFYRAVTHVLDFTNAAAKGLTPAQLQHPEDECWHCHLPVAKRVDGSWVHVSPKGQTDVGCRAALFDVDEDAWSASTSKTKATPSRRSLPPNRT